MGKSDEVNTTPDKLKNRSPQMGPKAAVVATTPSYRIFIGNATTLAKPKSRVLNLSLKAKVTVEASETNLMNLNGTRNLIQT